MKHLLWVVAGLSLGLLGCKSKSNPQVWTNSAGMKMIDISDAFSVAKYETTQKQFEQVMGYNPSLQKGEDHPVENLTSAEAEEFCRRLTELERRNSLISKDRRYDLPSWEEWLAFTQGAPEKGAVTPRGRTKEPNGHLPVGSGEASQHGVMDAQGNVSEFLRDIYPSTGSKLVAGANWGTHRSDFLSRKNRSGFSDPKGKDYVTGFRCVLRRE